LKGKNIGVNKSVKVDGNNLGIIITGDDNIVNQLSSHIIPKILTKQTGLANDINLTPLPFNLHFQQTHGNYTKQSLRKTTIY